MVGSAPCTPSNVPVIAAAVAALIAMIPAVRCVDLFRIPFPPFPILPARRALCSAVAAATCDDAFMANDVSDVLSNAPALISSMAFKIACEGVGTRFLPFTKPRLFAFTAESVSNVISITSDVGRLKMASRICWKLSLCEFVSSSNASSR